MKQCIKTLKIPCGLPQEASFLFSALLLPVYPVLAYDDDPDRAVSQIKALSPEEQLRMKDVLGSTPVSKEQRCTVDYNCCSTRYFDQNGKFIGSSEGCLNSDPDEPFKYDPSMEFFDKDGKPIAGETPSERK